MKDRLEKILISVLPNTLASLLGTLYGFALPAKNSYSQYGEDLILLNFFKFIGVSKGFYVDIGSYHPRLISNTHLLYKNGWRGICVDLDETKLVWFRAFRGRTVETICAGVSDKNNETGSEKVKFFKHKRLLSEIDTLDEPTASKNKQSKGWDYTVKNVSLIGINQVLERCPDKKIDLLNIDVEGLDEKLMFKIDLRRFSPKVILFEDNLNYGGSIELKRFLKCNGYSQLFISCGSVAYYRRDLVESASDTD